MTEDNEHILSEESIMRELDKLIGNQFYTGNT